MTYELARAALPWAIAAFGLSAFVVGYLVGSGRTFASMKYFDENLGMMFSTMLPWFGEPHWLRQRRKRQGFTK